MHPYLHLTIRLVIVEAQEAREVRFGRESRKSNGDPVSSSQRIRKGGLGYRMVWVVGRVNPTMIDFRRHPRL